MSENDPDRFRPHPHPHKPYDWVGAIAERRATLSPDRVALHELETDERYTYADLNRRANRTARFLRSQGVGKGDRVAVVSRNRVEFVDLFLGTAKLGAVLAPLSHRLAERELTAVLGTVDPTILLAECPFEGDVIDALDGADIEPELRTIPCDDEHAWKPYTADLPEDASPVSGPSLANSDPHLLLHTGGSTGLPKETVISHGSILWNAFNTITAWGLRPDDVTPMTFPMFHTGGWNVITVPLFHMGGTVVISREVDPGEILETIQRHEATVLIAVPAVLRMMTDHESWADIDLSSLRFVKSGGGPSRKPVIEQWRERGVEFSQGYGLTECGPNNFAMPDDFASEKTASVGVPVPYADARVVDEDDNPVEEGAIGELELSGPHAADRYLDNPDESADAFGEWVSTGDLCRVDHDGYYHIEGRIKNMFVSGGENVYPPQVEDAIAEIPEVEEVVVIGVPDETWGTVGKAVIQGDESLTLEDLESAVAGRIARFQIPKHLEFIEEMPMSGPSKIDRTAIEDQYGESREE